MVLKSNYHSNTTHTRLLRDAEARGCRTISGKWMLVYQAVEQLERWTHREAPVDVMVAAFDSVGS